MLRAFPNNYIEANDNVSASFNGVLHQTSGLFNVNLRLLIRCIKCDSKHISLMIIVENDKLDVLWKSHFTKTLSQQLTLELPSIEQIPKQCIPICKGGN